MAGLKPEDMHNDQIKQRIIKTVLDHYPTVQGIYLFGSYGTESEWLDSDIDIALLLPHNLAKEVENLVMSRCRFDLEDAFHKEVDLLNVRLVSTVFQKEIIDGDNLIYCVDRFAVDEFEMLAISYYQKLNEERREILDSFMRTGRAYAV
ncbi:MAG: nucleotidyltransferase domain-containing protein [Pseudomonadota bacterium]